MFKKITSKMASLNVRSWGGKVVASVMMMVAMAMVAQSAQAAITEVMGSYTSTKGEAWSQETDIDWDNQKVVIAISDVASRGTETSKIEVLSFCGSNHSLGWSAYAVTFYNQGVNLLKGYSFKTSASSFWSTDNFANNGTQLVEISKAEGVKINGTVRFSPSQLQDLLSCNRIKIGCTNAAQKCTYDYIRLVSTNTASASIENITAGTCYSSKHENEAFAYHQEGGWVDTYDIDWNNQKIIVEVSAIGSNYSQAQVVNFSAGSTAPGWGPKAVLCYNYSAANYGFHNMLTGSGSGTEARQDHAKGSLPSVFELSKNGGLKLNGTTIFTSSQLSYLWNENTVKVGVNGSWSDACTIKYVRVVSTDYASATGNILNESATNVFAAQNNVSVQLQRTLYADGWNTFCVPFNIDETTIAQVFGEGTKIRQYASMSDMTMNFEEATSIEAGKPYLIQPANDKQDPLFEGVSIVAGDPQTVGDNSYQMVGTYGLTTLTTNGTNLFLGADNKFYKPENESVAQMKGMRAYFVVPAGTNQAALVANIDGTFTSIDQIDGAKVVENAPVYNLSGQRVGYSLQGLSRGIYVQNGKKYVVK